MIEPGGPVPNEQVLAGVSVNPPSLTGDLIFGILVAWGDENGQINLASSQSDPPYQPYIVNPDWSTFSTPAVALALEWGRVYLAWTDSAGIHLANSGDGWSVDTVLEVPVNKGTAPALAFSGDTLYISWSSDNSMLGIATCDFDGNIVWQLTSIYILSAPSLTITNGNLYALVLGPVGGTNNGAAAPNDALPLVISIYLSTDGGQSFNSVPTQNNTSLGPPALAVVGDLYYLIWADSQTGLFNEAVTQSLEEYAVINYTSACHNGAPALLALPDTLIAGWSFGGSNDPRVHHITLGQLPLSSPPRTEEEIKKHVERCLYTPERCPDPLTVYDPAQNKCVPRGGCVGSCVLSSIVLFQGLPVFNPIKYALCMISCI